MPIVDVRGPADATPTFAMLHGSPGDERDLDLVAAHAPPDARVAFVALLDHGSAPDEPRLDLAPIEADLEASLRSLATPGELVVVGYSFSAYLAARLLARGAVPVARAVLVSGYAYLEEEQMATRSRLGDAMESGAIGVPELRSVLRGLFLGSLAADEVAGRHIDRLLDTTPWPRVLRIPRRLALVADRARAVGPFVTPAVVIHGERERGIPVHLGRALAALGRDARFVALDTDSHALPWTHPGPIAQEVFGEVPSG